MVGGFFAAQRGGVLIMGAPSAKELGHLMTSLPFWGRLKWKVIPLQTFQSGIDDLRIQIEAIKKMAEMAPAPR